MSTWVAQHAVCTSRTFLFVDQSSPNFFCLTWKGLRLIGLFSDVRYVDPFRRYSGSKSKFVRNRAEFWTFFLTLPNFRGQAFQKLYADYNPCLKARSLEKFREDISTSPKVIEAHTLNFRPDFNFHYKILFFWGGNPVPVGVCAR